MSNPKELKMSDESRKALDKLLMQQKIEDELAFLKHPPMHRQLGWDTELYELVAVDVASGKIMLKRKEGRGK